MTALLTELKVTIRSLAKRPAFTVVAICVLALGIGANTAMFSIINNLVLKPRSADARGPLMGLYQKNLKEPNVYRAFSYADFVEIRDSGRIFEDVMAHTFAMVAMDQGESARRVFATIVSSNYFATLDGVPVIGRAFTADEERPGADIPVVVVSYAFWKSTNFDPDVIGGTLEINARQFTVVGVAPDGFAGTMAIIAPELWFPLGVYDRLVNDMFREDSGRGLADRRHRNLMLAGHLADGLNTASANEALAPLAAQLARSDPGGNADFGLVTQTHSRVSVSTRPQEDDELGALAALLLGMSGMVLLIACLNLANMMLARASGRRREIAVRLAIGASRPAILRQLLAEGLVLSVAGSAAGLLLAYWITTALVSSLAGRLPMTVTFDSSPDGRLLLATAVLAVLSTVAFALVPALKLSRADVLSDLKDQPSSEALGRMARRFSGRNLLVVGQIALSLTLLTAGGLFLRGAWHAATADPGFALDGRVVATLDPSLAAYDEARGRELYRELLQRIAGRPDVAAASIGSLLPFGEFNESRMVHRPGATPSGSEGEGVDASYYIVGTGYFESLGLPIRRGRDFTVQEAEQPGGLAVAIVDEPLVRELFGDANPIGERISMPRRGDGVPPIDVTIVGVVPGLRHSLFDREPNPHVYVPFGQHYRANMHLHVATRSPGLDAERAMLVALRQEIRAIDPHLPVVALKSFRTHRDTSLPLWIVKTGADLFTAFGMVALALAAVGVYGVKAYVVSRRTREIGIRMALGADRSAVLWMVLREGLMVTAAGLLIGLALAAVAAQAISGVLYRVSALDPLVFVAAPATLLAAATLACYLPARRATRVAPVTALRHD